METLACIKRVPDTGATIVLTEDNRSIDTTGLGFTMSPHEECAVEEAVQQVEEHGGAVTALTLGSEEATEQLQTALAMQADEAILLETDGGEWGATATVNAIAEAVRSRSEGDVAYDLLLFGNESADAGSYQVGVRVAHELDLPCVTGVKSLTVEDGTAIAKRDVSGGAEVFEVDLPAVVAVKEGINSPRYPSIRSRMQARKQSVDRSEPDRTEGNLQTVRFEAPEDDDSPATVLGEGPEAVPDTVAVLEEIGVL
jgi:electron transfer flavoprotein beta subunit